LSIAVVYTVGVVADTHVPDRVANLHPGLIPALRDTKVDLILHAGDISSQIVLDQLGMVAPVIAAKGNRDWGVSHLEPVVNLTIKGHLVSLMHGHGSWTKYFLDKIKYLKEGYRLERYLSILLNTSPDAQIIIFGHTHRPVNLWYNNTLVFNPGSTGLIRRGNPPAYGILRFFENSTFEGEIIKLRGAKIIHRRWD
jgi:putative phosphoesterase